MAERDEGKNMDKQRTTVGFPPVIKAELDRYSKAAEIPTSDILNEAVTLWLERREALARGDSYGILTTKPDGSTEVTKILLRSDTIFKYKKS